MSAARVHDESCMKYFRKNLRAFSIAEVMLSVFVLSVGLLAVVKLMSESLNYSYDNNDSIIASELAQEGIELVRNVRDNDIVAGNTGFTAFRNDDRHCRIDWNSSNLGCDNNIGYSNRYVLQYRDGRYTNTASGASGKFSRYVHIDYQGSASANNEYAIVRSFVYWDGFTLPTSGSSGIDTANCVITKTKKCVYVEAFLTSWK